MSITCGRMIDEVKGQLQSWSADDQATTLEASILATDFTFQVTVLRGAVLGLSQGIVEIDRELLYVTDIGADGTATVAPWGRGYMSTTPAAHSTGARVVSQPQFPRQKIIDALNQVTERIFPKIFAVGSYETTVTLPVMTYVLPTGAVNCLLAKWQKADGRQYWQTVNSFRVSPGGGTIFGDTGVTVDVADRMTVGRPIQFLYTKRAGLLVDDADDFATATGLQASIEDLITLGASIQLLYPLELARLQQSSIEQQNRAALVAPAAALTSTRFLEARFQTRLAEEQDALRELFPPRVQRTWS